MEIYKSNSGLEFRVLRTEVRPRPKGKGTNAMWIIQFTETGTTATVYRENAKKGKVKDPYAKTCLGGAHTGIPNRSLPYWRQANQLWRNMLKRCYSEKDPKGYYGTGVIVDERWLCFENFLNDIDKLENFKLWLSKEAGPYNLDKDLKFPGNTVYCKEACSFVTEYENKAAGARNGKPFTKVGRI